MTTTKLPESVRRMIDDPQAPTAPLDEFVAAYNDDDNLWWRVGCGHHLNLFDEAVALLAWDELPTKMLKATSRLAVDTRPAGKVADDNDQQP